jgi:hypothetical protein
MKRVMSRNSYDKYMIKVQAIQTYDNEGYFASFETQIRAYKILRTLLRQFRQLYVECNKITATVI